MNVVVAIVAYANSADVERCVSALARSTHQDFNIFVCENGGAEAFAALTAALPVMLPGGQTVTCVLAPSNLGYAGGVNACIGHSPEADAWWVLNPDTVPDPGALEAMVARLGEGDCDGVGCTIHLPNGRLQARGGRWQPWLARAISMGHGSPRDSRADPKKIEENQNFLNGASMLVSRRFVDIAGLMREDYFLYCEEVEWCLRARDRGLRLGYAANAEILHLQGTTTGNVLKIAHRSRRSIFLQERNRLLLTRDCFPRLLPFAAVATLATLFGRYLRRAAVRQFFFGVQGWMAGLADCRGPERYGQNRTVGALPG